MSIYVFNYLDVFIYYCKQEENKIIIVNIFKRFKLK